MTQSLHSSRRDFLVKSAALTGGLVLGVRLPTDVLAAAGAAAPEVTHWIQIHPDDTVVVKIARSELGQGTFTGLAQLVAEELECDWSKVRAEYADVNEHLRRIRIAKSARSSRSAATPCSAAGRGRLPPTGMRQPHWLATTRHDWRWLESHAA